jgi:hypothetical protein
MADVLSGEDTSQLILSVSGIIALSALGILILLTIYGKLKGTSILGNVGYLSSITTALLPFLVIAAGPIVDMINNQFQYNVASITGLASIFYTSFIGSQKFTDFATGISSGITNLFGGYTFVFYILILAIYMGLSFLVFEGTVLTVTVLVSVSLFLLPLTLGALGLLRTSTVVPIPITSLPGKIAAWASGTPIVAAAATGGGLLEVSGDACILSGYDFFETPIAPSNIILPMTVLACHMIEYADTQNTGGVISVGGLAASILALQWVSFISNGCSRYYSSSWAAPIVALAISGIFAGSSYGILKYWTGGTENFGTEGIFHPTTAAPPPKTKTAGKSDILIKTSGAAVTASADLFEKADDEDYEEVVGMLFKDGEPISDVSILKS